MKESIIALTKNIRLYGWITMVFAMIGNKNCNMILISAYII